MKRLLEISGGEANFPVGDTCVSRIVCDSRLVSEGDLFVAIDGATMNGHIFVPEALEKGAVAAVVERESDPSAKLIVVPDTRIALAEMSKEYYGRPDERLAIAGITGTNGKTTVTYMVSEIARAQGLKFGSIGTLGYSIGREIYKLDFTTPDPTVLFEILSLMANAGLDGAAMEVSSHGLAQRRSWSIEYRVVAFTNLTQDHLDFHGDMESYFAIKSGLFENIDSGTPSVINIDDQYGKRLVDRTSSDNIITVGIHGKAVITAGNILASRGTTSFDLQTPVGSSHVELKIPGRFNVYNALVAGGIGFALNWSLSSIIEGLEAFTGVPGRLEPVIGKQPFAVYVDYSHTPDALENAIRSCAEIADGRIIVVFGCGGDRDRDKRPKMGRVAGENANIVILTSDNPRSEVPGRIIDEIEQDVPINCEKYRIDDRKSAIYKALELADNGDVVLISGKGHEDYQIIGKEKHHFDDRETAAEWLIEKGYRERS